MKPKDIKLETFEKERPFLQGSLFYVPKNKSFLEWKGFFQEPLPVVVEYCSGNGTWIVNKALKFKDKNFIAVERRFDRVRKILSKCQNLGIKNLLVVWGEAETFTKHYIEKESVSEIYINFPDPWPKRRHEKHRLLDEEFVHDLTRILKREGAVTVATDDEPYAQNSYQTFCDHFSSEMVSEIPDYGDSFFDALWRSKGKSIFYITSRKKT